MIQKYSLNGYYFSAMSTAMLINYANVFGKLSLLNDFDGYMTKAVTYLDDKVYIDRIYIGRSREHMW